MGVRKWTDEEVNNLKKYIKEGYTSREMVAFFDGRTPYAIRKKRSEISSNQKAVKVDHPYKNRTLKFDIDEFAPKELTSANVSKLKLVGEPKQPKRQFFEGQYRSKNNGNVEKVLSIFDMHYPEWIDIGPCLEFAKDIKVDQIQFVGDWWDLWYISRWCEKQRKFLGVQGTIEQLKKEVRGLRAFFVKVRQMFPDTLISIYEGNHEARYADFMMENPQVANDTIPSLLGFDDLGIKWYSRGAIVRIGKIFYTHGDILGNGSNPTRKAIQAINGTVKFGHFHKYQVEPGFSMSDDKDNAKLAISVPCMSTLAPEYLKGCPNNWHNGFSVDLIKKSSGNFTNFTIPCSPKGHFITLDGKEYT